GLGAVACAGGAPARRGHTLRHRTGHPLQGPGGRAGHHVLPGPERQRAGVQELSQSRAAVRALGIRAVRPRPIEQCRGGPHPGSMQQPVAGFRSMVDRACEERAFVLTAVGIDNQIAPDDDGHVLLVEQPLRAHALHHLWQYEQERLRRPAPAERLAPRPGAWWGSLVYVLVLLLPPFALAQGWLRADPYEFATLNPALIRAGEWWRVFTALTLHWDAAHLLSNLGGGALLGFSAAQVWGSARAWLLILVAAVAANVIEAWVGL